jgi:hypothetical protein
LKVTNPLSVGATSGIYPLHKRPSDHRLSSHTSRLLCIAILLVAAAACLFTLGAIRLTRPDSPKTSCLPGPIIPPPSTRMRCHRDLHSFPAGQATQARPPGNLYPRRPIRAFKIELWLPDFIGSHLAWGRDFFSRAHTDAARHRAAPCQIFGYNSI